MEEAEAEVRRDLAAREAAGRARVEAEAAEQRRELDRALAEAAEQANPPHPPQPAPAPERSFG